MGYWPGSAVHQRVALEHPRWEDFDYQSFNKDSLSWMGNGLTTSQMNNTPTTGYLETVDVPRMNCVDNSGAMGVQGTVAVSDAVERVICCGDLVN